MPTYLSRAEYPAAGTDYVVPFLYIDQGDVKALVNTTPATFTWLTPTTIRLDSTPGGSDVVTVYRETPRDARLVSFGARAYLSSPVLETDSKQGFYLVQELLDEFDVLRDDISSLAFDSGNVAAPLAPEVGGFLKATDVGTFGWQDIDVSDVANAASDAELGVVSGVANAAQAAANAALPKAGGVMTGAIVLPGNASLDLHAVPRQQVGWETIVDPVVVSGSPTVLDFVIPAGFLAVELVTHNLQPSAGNPVLRLQMSSNGGSSFYGGGSDYVTWGRFYNGSTGTDFGGTEGAATLGRVQNGVLINHSIVSLNLAPRGVGSFRHVGWNSSAVELRLAGVYCAQVADINALRLLWDTAATFAGGVVSLRGIRA